jgi:hypothetical protein
VCAVVRFLVLELEHELEHEPSGLDRIGFYRDCQAPRGMKMGTRQAVDVVDGMDVVDMMDSVDEDTERMHFSRHKVQSSGPNATCTVNG